MGFSGTRFTLAVAILGLMWSAVWGQSKAQEVSIPDANLRAALEDSLGKASGASITDVELARLTRLSAPNAGIVDLTGLEFATGLTRLHLGLEIQQSEPWTNSNDISDLSPLKNLTNLTVLVLSGNSILDVSPLRNLTNLTVLLLDRNLIMDVSPLRNLIDLTILGLSYNPVQDASSIRDLENHLTKLTYRILLGTGIRNHPKLDSVLYSMLLDYEFSLSREGSTAHLEPPPRVMVYITISSPTRHIDSIMRFLQDNGVSYLGKTDDPSLVNGLIIAVVPVTLLVRLAEQPGVRQIRFRLPPMPHRPSGVTGMSWGRIKARHK